jgi:hypothetical protein
MKIESVFELAGGEFKVTVPPERFREMLYEAFADAAKTTLERAGELATEIYGPESEAATVIVPRLTEELLRELG